MIYYIRADGSKTSDMYEAVHRKAINKNSIFKTPLTILKIHLTFQSVSPLDRFIDWHVRELLTSSELWFLIVDEFLTIFEGTLQLKSLKFLPFNPERVRRTHFDLSRLYKTATKAACRKSKYVSAAPLLIKS